MSRRRLIRWACACGFGLALVLAAAVVRQSRLPKLPPFTPHGNLPAQFDEALKAALAKASSRGRSADDVRDLARLYQANRLFPEARACYTVIAVRCGGLSARDHYYLAAIAEDDNDPDGALAEFRATLKADPSYQPARLVLADALFKSGQPDDAAKEYAALLAADANQPRAAFGMARVDLQRGDDKAAVALLKELIAHHPDSTSGAALLAQILDRQGNADDAAAMRELSNQTHEPVPPDPWMKALLVDCYDRERLGMTFEEYRLDGQIDEALPLLGRLEELDPNGWIPPMLHGWSDKEAGRYPQAVKEYKEALRRGGDPERICPLLVAALLTDHRVGEAAALLADYHARLPHSIPILRSYSEVAVRMKDDALARSLLAELLKADPYLYMPNMSMVQILWNSGDRDGAAQCLRRVASVFPADVDSRGLLGQYYMEKGDPGSAVAPLEQAAATVPPNDARRDRITKMLDTAYLTAGSLKASHGKFSEAVGFADKSIRLVPGNPSGYALKANACARMGDFSGAAGALEKLSALDPEEPTLQVRLGDAVYQSGDREGARTHWQRAMDMVPAGADDLRAAIAARLAGHVTPEMFN
jgi:predicted Zn-dependent protease